MPEAAAPPEATPARARTQTTTPPASALDAGGVAGLSTAELRGLFATMPLDGLFSVRASVEGAIVGQLGEVDKNETFKEDGATSTETWVAERFGVSIATARTLTRLAQKGPDMPRLLGSLQAGEISLDKVRALADVATRRSDAGLCAQAREHSVRELADIARTTAAARAATTSPSEAQSGSQSPSQAEYEGRYVRLNDDRRTLVAQLPKAAYAEVKAALVARAKTKPSDGTTPLDHRYCDALLDVVRGAGGVGGADPYVVVAHTALSTLVDDTGGTTALAGELEGVGLIDTETLKRVACDATIIIGVDDEAGHTMYEGRAERLATKTQRREVMRRDRTCRFPGCQNVTFADVHHIIPWDPGGLTNLDNLVLLCRHHHGVVHRNGWSLTGNANEDLSIVNPNGQVMTSRPSPIWARVTHPPG